ncbi:methylenetetrahydrofolate reductase [Collinsella sp. zg1085]|uniref:methylenetetrahydrofolate reductase n=1 Tax=Collinsella sp. zg1085 TaxID=2844380 RepID=UPI001C0B416E|nr:methylenetetrahydrofolate reductase [Collinsella sp. zg1085]QWT17847.1 methylenetetrahydrofolate reductase [Collinsella sp. zg1085]
MRIDTCFDDAARTKSKPVSFEMFPPKGEMSFEHAQEVARALAVEQPDFMSVTYSAGGSGNQGATAAIAQFIAQETHIPSMAHLTCISLFKDDLAVKIAELKAAGVANVLALRGDVPLHEASSSRPADFRYAKDIIPHLVEAGFCVGAAAYPEGHIACDDLARSIAHLKEKQDAGASFFVTQLFFDNIYFYRFQELATQAGITVPISAGIMPFMSKQQISRMIFLCGASLPAPVIKLLARWEDDPASLRAAGIEYACQQIEDLRAHGVDGLHIYTMNRADVARACMSAAR